MIVRPLPPACRSGAQSRLQNREVALICGARSGRSDSQGQWHEVGTQASGSVLMLPGLPTARTQPSPWPWHTCPRGSFHGAQTSGARVRPRGGARTRPPDPGRCPTSSERTWASPGWRPAGPQPTPPGGRARGRGWLSGSVRPLPEHPAPPSPQEESGRAPSTNSWPCSSFRRTTISGCCPRFSKGIQLIVDSFSWFRSQDSTGIPGH